MMSRLVLTENRCARQARDICAVASTCRRLRGSVGDAPHLFERSARAQTAAGVLGGVMRRAAAEAPELLILLRQKPLMVSWYLYLAGEGMWSRILPVRVCGPVSCQVGEGTWICILPTKLCWWH